jgi:inorganic pyrophosphatase
MNFDAIVEISLGSRNKYEFDPESNRMRFNRTLSTAVKYPTNYGYFPNTLAVDGDPLDCIIPSIEPITQGCIVAVRPVGVLDMLDQGVKDYKVLAVPITDVHWNHIHKLSDVPKQLLDEIEHFFKVYKNLEDKVVKVKGWKKKRFAEKLIKDTQI